MHSLPDPQFYKHIKEALRLLGRGAQMCARGFLAVTLIVGLNMMSFTFLTEKALAYYGDYESSSGNVFRAVMLDFDIQNNERSGFIGIEADGDFDDFSSIVTQHPDSISVQYAVDTEQMGGDADFCGTLDFHIIHSGTNFSDAKLSDLNLNTDHTILDITRPTTTAMGTWEFKDIDLENAAAQYPHGTECNVDLVFSGWDRDIPALHQSGYTDEERISLRLKNRMIVMNEFLPNPDPSAHGLNFGNDADPQPHGEWIEIYNNSLYSHDVSDWYIEDAAGNIVDVTTSNTDPATTTVPARGWLVIYMNGAVLNNGGDTIMLKNGNDTIIDEYTYDGDTYCENDPTPNATNTATATGDCSDVPPNKSYARIPDGSGAWVDPIPTPGKANKKDAVKLSMEPAVKGVQTQHATSTEETATSTSAEDAPEQATSTSHRQASSSATSSTNTASSTSDGSSATSSGTSGQTPSPSSEEPQRTPGTSTANTTDTASTTNVSASSSPPSDTPATSTPESNDRSASSTPDSPTNEGGDSADSDPSDASSTDPVESIEKATSTASTPQASEKDGDGDGEDDTTEDGSDTSREKTDPIESEEKTDPDESTENNTDTNNTNSESKSTTDNTQQSGEGQDAEETQEDENTGKESTDDSPSESEGGESDNTSGAESATQTDNTSGGSSEGSDEGENGSENESSSTSDSSTDSSKESGSSSDTNQSNDA